MSAPLTGPPDIRRIETDTQAAACYPLIQQLRPHIASADAFIARWRRQENAGYRLVALWNAGAPVGVAGYRLQENLFQGLHFYVDDLVTDETARSAGHGHALMAWLKDEAYRTGCKQLVLDTALTNMLGHRFYFRQGLLARAFRFSIDLEAAVA